MDISVPSSSGKSLQLDLGPRNWLRSYISVPSSSGKSLQRSIGVEGCQRRAISVPSSSGKSLQPSEPYVQMVEVEFQSPLHRGSLFNLTTSSFATSLTNFSPLFIGEVSSTDLALLSVSAESNFSPLFIGEVSSTSATCEPSCVRCSISVPSSSGKSLQPSAPPLSQTTKTQFQSPLHRGSLFNS